MGYLRDLLLIPTLDRLLLSPRWEMFVCFVRARSSTSISGDEFCWFRLLCIGKTNNTQRNSLRFYFSSSLFVFYSAVLCFRILWFEFHSWQRFIREWIDLYELNASQPNCVQHSKYSHSYNEHIHGDTNDGWLQNYLVFICISLRRVWVLCMCVCIARFVYTFESNERRNKQNENKANETAFCVCQFFVVCFFFKFHLYGVLIDSARVLRFIFNKMIHMFYHIG